jgi:enoyl-CoA hydratase/long-chain 3-hydroxyacyl-CoA dehydrogenase
MTLVDEVGIDVAASVGKNLAGDLGIRVGTADPALIERVISKGWLGRKSGKGMHIFPAGKGKKTVNPEMEALLVQVREERGKPSSGVSEAKEEAWAGWQGQYWCLVVLTALALFSPTS